MGEWRYSSTILDLGTRSRRVVSLTNRGKSSRYPLDRKLAGPQNWSRRCGAQIYFLPLLVIDHRSSSPSLYRLRYPGSCLPDNAYKSHSRDSVLQIRRKALAIVCLFPCFSKQTWRLCAEISHNRFHPPAFKFGLQISPQHHST
jgi:hypothetical protein